MKWKLILTFVLVVIASVVFWLFNNWINVHALAVAAGENYKLKAEGWSMLLSAWPLAVGAIAPGLVIGFLIAIGLLGFANDADKADLQAKLERAQEQVKTADARAKERVQQQQRAAQLAQELAEATELEAKAMIAHAQKQIEQAREEMKMSNAQKTKAMAYNERKLRRATKLKERIKAGEEITTKDVLNAL